MEIDFVAIWGVIAAVFFLASLAILMRAQKKLLKGELRNIVFWVYALILAILLVIILLLALSLIEVDPSTRQMVQVLVTLFIVISGLCAVRVAMLFLSFANIYGFAETFKEKAMKIKELKVRKRKR